MPRDTVRDADGYDGRLWRRLCREMELPGLHVPEQLGGAGAGIVEASIVFEELGRALAPVPLLSTTMALEAVWRMGDDAQRGRLLPGLLRGDLIGALAAVDDGSAGAVRAELRDGRSVLTGAHSPVLCGHLADVFVVPAITDGAVVCHLVEADAAGVQVERLPSFDSTRPVAVLRFDGAHGEPLSAGGHDGFARLLDLGRVLLAAEMLGGAEECLRLAVQYACSRHQFDRPIGSFQAVKHACAEMTIETDATRVAVMYAAMAAADPDELRLCAPLAKAQSADTYLLCAGSALQIHGGIAFTWEHDLHLYFRRAQTSAALFGSSAHHRVLLADRAGL